MTTLGPNQWMIALMFIAGLAACASNPSTEPHVFAFPAGCLDQNGRPNPDRVKCVFGARKNEIVKNLGNEHAFDGTKIVRR